MPQSQARCHPTAMQGSKTATRQHEHIKETQTPLCSLAKSLQIYVIKTVTI